jgi:Zn-finger nucleic acid-binding protein
MQDYPSSDENSTNKHHSYSCPACNISLEQLNIGSDTTIWNCEQCAGSFIFKSDFKQAIQTIIKNTHVHSNEKSFLFDTPRSITMHTTSDYHCPVCQKSMRIRQYDKNTDISIIQCDTHGFWLKSGELLKIYQLYKTEVKKSTEQNRTEYLDNQLKTDSHPIGNKKRNEKKEGLLSYIIWLVILYFPASWGMDLIEYTHNLYKNVSPDDVVRSGPGILYLGAFLIMAPFTITLFRFIDKIFGIVSLLSSVKKRFNDAIPSWAQNIGLRIIMGITGILLILSCYDGHSTTETSRYIVRFIIGFILTLPLFDTIMTLITKRYKQ